MHDKVQYWQYKLFISYNYVWIFTQFEECTVNVRCACECFLNINIFLFCLRGNLGQAELIGREALKLLPNDHTIMFSLANVLGKLQKYKVSELSVNIRKTFFFMHIDGIPYMILQVKSGRNGTFL